MKYQVHCKSCKITYDGNAQCCYDMDHEEVKNVPAYISVAYISVRTDDSQCGYVYKTSKKNT